MRILEIGMGAHLGGIEVYFHNYYKRIHDNCHFDFTDKDGGLYFSEEYSSNGSVIYHMPDFNKQPLKYYLTLKRIIKNGKYDAVHINMLSLANILPVFAAKAAKAKVIIHSHNAGVPSGGLRKILHFINKPFASLADQRLACSELAGKWMFDSKSFSVIPNAIDTDIFNLNNKIRKNQRSALNYSADDQVIGHVGRFAEQKNHEFIIDIFTELHKKNNKFKLLLIGDGELKKSIENKVNKAGLTDSVIFTGNIKNVQDYMQAMDLFILPSLFEGLPVTGIEAQACGLPCVFSSSITEELKVTENVEFVSLDDKNKWIVTIEKMISLPKSDNTEQIRAAGYDIKGTAKKLEKIYLSR